MRRLMIEGRIVCKNFIFTTYLCVLTSLAFAQGPKEVAGTPTVTAVKSGNWTSVDTWGGTIPGNDARVLIPAGITVTVDGIITQEFKSIRIATNGKLDYATTVNTELRTEYLMSEMAGSFEIGNSTNKVGAGVTARLVFAERGGTTRTEDPGRFAPGAVLMGPVRMHGADKTSWLALSTHPKAGSNQLILKSAPSGWRAGDVLAVAGTDINDYKSDEKVTISSISGSTITLTSSLAKSHEAPSQLADLVDVHVSNNTRNIVISSENTSVAAIGGDGYHKPRGHLMFMHNSDVELKYVETQSIGRTNKAIELDDWSVPEDESLRWSKTVPYPAGEGKNPRGRYSIHFHRTLDSNTNKALVEGCAVNNDPGWGYVSHSSHVDFINNVSYDVLGSAYCTEAGDELGSFKRNIAIRTYNPAEPLNLGRPEGGQVGIEGGRTDGLTDGREGISDFAHQGDGFWLHSTGVTLEGNVVSGCSGHAYIYWTEGLWESLRGRPEMQTRIDLYVPPGEYPELNAELKAHLAKYPNWKFDVWYILPRPFKDNIGYTSAQGFRGDYIMTEFHETTETGSAEFNLTPTNYRNTMNLVIENTVLWSIRRTGMQFENCAQITLKNNKIYGYGTSQGLAPWRPIPNPYPGYLEVEPEVIGVDLDQYHNTRTWTIQNNTIVGWEGEAQALTLPINATTVVDGGVFNNSGTDILIREVNWSKHWPDRVVSFDDNNMDPTPKGQWLTTPWRNITIKGNIQFGNPTKNIVLDAQFHLVNNAGDAFALLHPDGSGVKMPAYFLLPDDITFNFGPFNNSKIYFDEQRPDFIPVPTADLLKPLGFPQDQILPERITPNKFLNLSNQQLKTQFGSSFGGSFIPADAQVHTMITGGKATNVSSTSNQAPTCSITTPAGSSSHNENSNVNIEASATDSDGSITQVEFFVDDQSIGVDTSSPYAVTWKAVGAGNHTIHAVATDNAGATTKSAAVTITVNANQAPTCSITAPTNESTHEEGKNINIEATASDSDGSVTQVEFFVDNTSVGIDTAEPYSATWTAAGGGNHSIHAVATDNMGSTTKSTSITIIVSTDPCKDVAPGTPQDLVVTSNNCNSIVVSWSASNCVVNYRIQKRVDSGNWTTLDEALTLTTYTDTNVTSGRIDYQVRAQNNGLFSQDAQSSMVDCTVLGILSEDKAVSFYPNPVNGDLVNFSLNGLNGVIDLTIMDISGKILDHGSYDITTNNEVRHINTAGMKSGVYLFRVKYQNESKTFRIIKQ